MPRKKKGEGMRYKTKMITAPGSFFSESGLNPTEVYQDRVVEETLRMPVQHFMKLYGNGKHAYRPETPRQAAIRAARWVLEADIVNLYDLGANGVLLDVTWKLSGARTLLLAGIPLRAETPLPYHVIYDNEAPFLEIAGGTTIFGAARKMTTPEDIVKLLVSAAVRGISKGRWLILYAWLVRHAETTMGFCHVPSTEPPLYDALLEMHRRMLQGDPDKNPFTARNYSNPILDIRAHWPNLFSGANPVSLPDWVLGLVNGYQGKERHTL